MGDDSRMGVDVRDRGLPRLLAAGLPLTRPFTFFSDGFACFRLGFTVARVDGFGVMRSGSENSSTEKASLISMPIYLLLLTLLFQDRQFIMTHR